MLSKPDIHPSIRKFEWDENKNSSNIKKHGFDFADAAEMFRSKLLIRSDDRKDYGEERRIGVGTINGRVAVAIFTERRLATRIISLRKATKRERQEYEETIANGLGTH